MKKVISIIGECICGLIVIFNLANAIYTKSPWWAIAIHSVCLAGIILVNVYFEVKDRKYKRDCEEA